MFKKNTAALFVLLSGCVALAGCNSPAASLPSSSGTSLESSCEAGSSIVEILEEDAIEPIIVENSKYSLFKQDDLWGVLDENGEVFLPAQYSDKKTFPAGFIFIKQNDMWGFISTSGLVVEPQYENINEFHNGSAIVTVGGKSGVINQAGKFILPAVYEDISAFKKDRAIVKIEEKWGMVNTDGAILIPAQYGYLDFEGDFVHAYNIAFHPSGNGLFDYDGNAVLEPVYDLISYPLADGTRTICKNGKWGIIDEELNTVIPLEYDWIGETFQNGLVQVKSGEKYGYINRQNQMVIAPTYEYVTPFVNGTAIVFSSWNRVWKLPNYEDGLMPDIELIQYLYIDINNEVIYKPDTLFLDNSRDSDFHSFLSKNLGEGKYPVFDLSLQKKQTINLKGYYRALPDPAASWRSVFEQYDSDEIYSVIEWSEDLPFTLSYLKPTN